MPPDVRTEIGASAEDVAAYLDQDEWEFALDLLGDFGGIAWQPGEYWSLLANAAEELHLPCKWFHWRANETRQGMIRVELTHERRHPIPGQGVYRPLWHVGGGDHRVAAVWVEGRAELAPGDHAVVRLLALSPEGWDHLVPGDVVTMHEGQPVVGTATVIELARVGETRRRDR
ncbi:hypothetical protein [Lentzea sp. NPDC003310]|uniref:hypothetical protein n=1 Tax=Lentzea sp. NPDC003310 TaxID=3154447 RepID=UPI0033BE4721